MKINCLWDDDYSLAEIGLRLHPKNEHLIKKIENSLTLESYLEVIDPQNERISQLQLNKILMIEAMDNLSKVYTTDNEIYFVKGRLKDFMNLQMAKIFRINNSTILNLNEINGFSNGKYARLEVQTKNQQIFIVSRHYARQIREELR